MAAFGSVFVNCPVCDESLEVSVTTSRVAHVTREGDDLVASCTVFLAPPATWFPSSEHEACFALSDEDADRALAYFADRSVN